MTANPKDAAIRFPLASPTTATAVGGVALLAVVCVIPLAVLAQQSKFFNVGVIPLLCQLRRRVQRLVDRRFNRARYDAEAIVTAFTLRLRDAVDLDTVRRELLAAVDGAIQPSHASAWIRPPADRIGGWNPARSSASRSR